MKFEQVMRMMIIIIIAQDGNKYSGYVTVETMMVKKGFIR